MIWRAFVLALLPVTVMAEGRGDALAALLEEVPQAVASPAGEGIAVYFSDFGAAAPLVAAMEGEVIPGMNGPLGWHARANMLILGDSIGTTAGFDWPALLGFGLGDLRQAATAGRPPDVMTVLTLDPAVIPAIGPALTATGYAPDDRLGQIVFWRGEADHAVDFNRRNPSDPFGGSLGQSSRVLVQGDMLFQAAGWPVLAATLGEFPVVADSEGVQALLAALDNQGLGEGALVRAVLLPRSESLAIAALPISLDMTDEEIAAALEVLGTAPDPEVQALALAMVSGPALIGDIASPGEAVGLLALTFTDRTQAMAMGDHVARAWGQAPSTVSGESFSNMLGPVRVIVTGKGPFVTLLIVPGTTGPDLRNAGFDMLHQAWLMRDMVFLPRL